MKAVILAGGLGTRISEETHLKPKPMVEIGGFPIIWHIMKIYSAFGVNDFLICCGYKGYVIKEYFANYFLHMSDVTFDMKKNSMEVHRKQSEPWNVTLVNTGNSTITGGRLKKMEPYLSNEEAFFFTYGDGVANVDINELLLFHKRHKKLATVTAVKQPPRYGSLILDENRVIEFSEKPESDQNLINGGFFVLSPKVLSYIKDDDTHWEEDPIKKLTMQQELVAYKHLGFWQSMDTLREKIYLEKLWQSGTAPWKIWD